MVSFFKNVFCLILRIFDAVRDAYSTVCGSCDEKSALFFAGAPDPADILQMPQPVLYHGARMAFERRKKRRLPHSQKIRKVLSDRGQDIRIVQIVECFAEN